MPDAQLLPSLQESGGKGGGWWLSWASSALAGLCTQLHSHALDGGRGWPQNLLLDARKLVGDWKGRQESRG